MTERIVENNADARRDYLRRAGEAKLPGVCRPADKTSSSATVRGTLGTLTFYPSTKKRMCA
jgi:hypothetical protein